MIIVKGHAVIFEMEDGKKIRPGARAGMMHDPKGTHWGKNSILVGPYAKGSEPATDDQYNGPAKDYLGRNYHPHVGEVNLPPRSLSQWETIGSVKTIYYRRPGTKAPGGYRHTFNKPRGMMHVVFAVKGRGFATLRKHGSFYRLDLPSGSILDDRGIAWP